MKSSASDRLACVDLPAFALQLLLKRHPEWRAYPAAVVAEDKPQGLVLQINERASAG
jgi:protein ImuB